MLPRLEGKLADAELAGKGLQLTEAFALAVAVKAVAADVGIEILDARAARAGAVMAVQLVLAEHFGEGRLAQIKERGAVGRDGHALGNLDGAGELFLLRTRHGHDAEPARRVHIHALIGAERRDADADRLRRVQNAGPFGDGDGLAVDGQIHVFHLFISTRNRFFGAFGQGDLRWMS